MNNKRALIIERSVNLAALICFFLLWEFIAGKYYTSSKSFPPPSKIINGFSYWFSTDNLLPDILISLIRVLIGFVIGSVLGIVVGTASGVLLPVRWVANPIIQMLRPIPPIALVTLTIIWFGIGEISKYFLIAWAVFFQVWISTFLGIIKIDHLFIWAGQSLNAKGFTLIRKVIIPASLPSIIIGLRMGISGAFFSLIAAELTGSFRGLGYRIDLSSGYFRSDVMLAAIIMLGILGALLDRLFVFIANVIFPWYKNKGISG